MRPPGRPSLAATRTIDADGRGPSRPAGKACRCGNKAPGCKAKGAPKRLGDRMLHLTGVLVRVRVIETLPMLDSRNSSEGISG